MSHVWFKLQTNVLRMQRKKTRHMFRVSEVYSVSILQRDIEGKPHLWSTFGARLHTYMIIMF